MLPTIDTKTFQLSSYTIRQQPRFDNRAFPQFLIFHKGKLIGKQMSMPVLTDCDWHKSRHGTYATADESRKWDKGLLDTANRLKKARNGA